MDKGFDEDQTEERSGAKDANDERFSKRFWKKFWSTLGHIPFSEEVGAAYFCALDPTTPARVKAILIAAIAYFVTPTDLLPDFIAGLGFTDDATVLLTAFSMIGGHVKDHHRSAIRQLMGKAEVSE